MDESSVQSSSATGSGSAEGCFGYDKPDAAYKKILRLKADGYVEDDKEQGCFKKLAQLLT